MKQEVFKKTAAFIARRNVTERVVRVQADYDFAKKLLRVVYCTKNDPTDDDWEYCELTCGELISEFPEIEYAETNCFSIEGCGAIDESLIVYSR